MSWRTSDKTCVSPWSSKKSSWKTASPCRHFCMTNVMIFGLCLLKGVWFWSFFSVTYQIFEDFLQHENYSQNPFAGYPNDACMLKLTIDVDITQEGVGLACLPDDSLGDFAGNENCWISGWGLTRCKCNRSIWSRWSETLETSGFFYHSTKMEKAANKKSDKLWQFELLAVLRTKQQLISDDLDSELILSLTGDGLLPRSLRITY